MLNTPLRVSRVTDGLTSEACLWPRRQPKAVWLEAVKIQAKDDGIRSWQRSPRLKDAGIDRASVLCLRCLDYRFTHDYHKFHPLW